jgi:hypothetical protein
MTVGDADVPKARFQRLLIKLRIPAGKGDRANIHQLAYPMVL